MNLLIEGASGEGISSAAWQPGSLLFVARRRGAFPRWGACGQRPFELLLTDIMQLG